jgi:hypothetical protein
MPGCRNLTVLYPWQAWLDPACFFLGDISTMKLSYRYFVFVWVIFGVFFNTQAANFKDQSRIFSELSFSSASPQTGESVFKTPAQTAAVSPAPPQAIPYTASRSFLIDQIQLDSYDFYETASPSFFEPPAPPAAHPHSDSLHEFIGQVSSGDALALVGVFVEDTLALPVVQQPEGDPFYVSTILATVTQFQSAAANGITGLLAHNYLSGELFFNLEVGQEVNIIHGDGHAATYRVSDIQSYEKLPGTLQNSHYVNLETGQVISTPDLFNWVYSGSDKVTFQTCIKRGRDWSWGRIFIIATPIES